MEKTVGKYRRNLVGRFIDGSLSPILGCQSTIHNPQSTIHNL